MKKALVLSTLFAVSFLESARADATGVKITEWMYNTTTGKGEFVEFTNFGPSPVDFTGWSYDDNSRLAGSFSLSGFGTVAIGESVVLTEVSVADFRTAWGLSASVKIVGASNQNLGRGDEINLYNASNTLVDRLTYDDAGNGASGTVAGPQTSAFSGHPIDASVLGANNASQWVLSSVGDADGSYTSGTSGTIASTSVGSPGHTSIPEPGSALLLALGAAGLNGARRRG